jgi:hypothetical protein
MTPSWSRLARRLVRVVVADLVPGDGEQVHITNLDAGAEHVRPRRAGLELWRGFMPIYAKPEGAAERAPTGDKTHVTGPAKTAFDQIVRRADLGPQ